MAGPILPEKTEKEPLEVIAVRVPKPVKAELEAIAQEHGLSLSAVGLRFIQVGLEEYRRSQSRR